MTTTNIGIAIDLIRFIPLLIVFGYAAYKDYKTGEVPNKIWLYSIIGATLTLVQTALFFSIPLFFITTVVMLSCVGLGFLFFLLGAGGADAKALMTLGLSAPLLPLWSFLWPIPTILLAMMIACIAALPFLITQETKESFWKRKIRFLPFIFIGLIVSVII
jgi:Flp pilus assembly protein protease CpaA